MELDYHEWHPIYMKILRRFGFSHGEDIKSAHLLGELRGSDGLAPLKSLKGKRVEIQGPLIEKTYSDVCISAGSALSAALKKGASPDLMVTDLDGDTHKQLETNLEGVPAVIHAHGDNMDLVKRWAQEFTGHVVSTCQCRPIKGVYNFGGFTDGDRAVFIADHFGAGEILLNGWDFEPSVEKVGPVKQAKLRWAKRLVKLVDAPVTCVD
ncbi:MAG: 6-hydroxymethylpterin diphosphokinase MptE-like protein [Thermoplasmata archaeon]